MSQNTVKIISLVWGYRNSPFRMPVLLYVAALFSIYPFKLSLLTRLLSKCWDGVPLSLQGPAT